MCTKKKKIKNALVQLITRHPNNFWQEFVYMGNTIAQE
jgi:hypothetical protein